MEGSQLPIDEDEAFVFTEAEKDHAQRALQRHNATVGVKSLKRPRNFFEEVEAERPDLDRYFNEFADIGEEITFDERIKICRAYASYLASLLPKKKK